MSELPYTDAHTSVSVTVKLDNLAFNDQQVYETTTSNSAVPSYTFSQCCGGGCHIEGEEGEEGVDGECGRDGST